MKVIQVGLSVCLGGLLVGCATNPGRTTGLGAATGGVIGAGLGAVVGSQTGDPGAGLALGAVAGSSAGALIGNTIEAQEKDLARQSELIRKQEAAIMAHRAELERLRRELGDNDFGDIRGSYKNPGESDFQEEALEPDAFTPEGRGTAFRDRFMNASNDVSASRSAPSRSAPIEPFAQRDMEQRDSVSYENRAVSQGDAPLAASHPLNRYAKFKAEHSSAVAAPSAPKARNLSVVKAPTKVTQVVRAPIAAEKAASEPETYVSPRALAVAEKVESSKIEEPVAVVTSEPATSEVGAIGRLDENGQCGDAQTEMARADQSELSADKLFHLRRALRLCPGDSRYHIKLAKLYGELGRDGDAAYEYHEALRLDPSNAEARSGLKTIGD